MLAKNSSRVPDSHVILSRFVRDGRIMRLPAKQSMRLVVLAWLAEKFVPEKSYSESEVNEALANHDVDHAYLRRSLVDFGFFDRNRGEYRRT